MAVRFNSISPNFAGKYILNANQTMPNEDFAKRRDLAVGAFISKAKNNEELSKIMGDFYGNGYYKDKTQSVEITLDLPDKYNSFFEKIMRHVGQDYKKLIF